MGAWLGAASPHTPETRASFHPMLREKLNARFGVDAKFIAYAQSRRAPNPAWHMAVSQALHHFALELAPEIVERKHLGKLIYAGGDDVLAMLATKDLLGAAALLRAVYSGVDPAAVGARERDGGLLQRSGKGWAHFDGRVLRLMGEHASASAGLVIAHHQAPLGAVMRELRAAERRAKALTGKNAWSLAVLKRGGGALHVSAHWGEPLRLFEDLRSFLASDDVSRRAAYHLVDWLHEVPPDASDLAESMLAYQMARQSGDKAKALAPGLAQRLVALAFDPAQRPADALPLPWLADFMMAAEFLARAQRHAGQAEAPASVIGALLA
jgi:CRISPR-associated protein Cmr2